MFIANPDPYLLPSYRISPFRTADIAINAALPDSSFADEYFDQRFGEGHYAYTRNGREALHLALSQYNLQPEDVVTIYTSTQNFYISSCVTNEIEKFCKWSRKIEPDSKVLLVNHEFGIPYPDMQEIRATGLPLIEDCAFSFFSDNVAKEIGRTGDFAIYSFPKYFPLQVGGIIVSKEKKEFLQADLLQTDLLQYIKRILSKYLHEGEENAAQRILNYHLLTKELAPRGIRQRFEIKEGIVPGVFMFRFTEKRVDLQALKSFFYAHGIQCSVFYGEDAFFIPCHQNIGKEDISYFGFVLNEFLTRCSN